MKITYISPYNSTCGYGAASRYYIESMLHNENIDLTCLDIQKLDEDHKDDSDEIIVYYNPTVNTAVLRRYLSMSAASFFRKASLMTVWEYEDIPLEWAENIKRFKTIIVPSNFSAVAFRKYHDNVKVVPYYVAQPKSIAKPEEDTFKLLSICSRVMDRKGIDLLLEAFTPLSNYYDDIVLTIKIFIANKVDEHYLEQLKRLYLDGIRPGAVIFESGDFTKQQMDDLIYSNHAHILLSRGEGFGLPYAETALAGLPNIYPEVGGQVDFMKSLYTGFPVKCYKDEQLTYNVCHYDGGEMYIPRVDDAFIKMVFMYKLWKEDKDRFMLMQKDTKKYVSSLLNSETIINKLMEAIQ